MEGDSQTLIEAINGVIQIPWRLFTIVHNVRALIPCFQVITFNHILCEANIVEDALAAIGHQIPSRHVWLDQLPSTAARAAS